MNTKQESNLVKIRLPVPSDNMMRADAEWIWAEPQEDGTYIIANVPFLAKGLSYDDVIEAEPKDGALVFTRVVRYSGHSTYRIYASAGRSNSEVSALLDKIHRMNCDIEVATEKLLAIDVLPQADIYNVHTALSEAEEAGVIDFEEGHCGHPLRRTQ